jgi:hypothetical protein
MHLNKIRSRHAVRVASKLRRLAFLVLSFILLGVSRRTLAASSAFDLVGPQIKMTVTRDGKILPMSRVAELRPGDKLWVNAEFPADQSERFLLIVAFLQGPTNPPPDAWFTRAETWNKQTRAKGTTVTVPAGAEQVVMFLAPETGGDFSTLRSTVRARPGLFVRATADLEQATLERTRLDKYLQEVQKTSETDPAELKKRSTLLAQTLRIKLNEDCFSKPLEQQPSCLTQNSDQLVIGDEQSQSVVAMLTSGPSSDLITALGASPAAKGGYYSPYVGAVVDAARLLNNLRTAAYQYIPALSLPDKDDLVLRLNSPPSFHNPKSVLVVGLPHIGAAILPALQNLNPKHVLCLQQSPLVLPVEGTPVVFSTAIAHDFVLRVEGKGVAPVDLPATADAVHGGFVIDTHTLHADALGPKLTGTLRGTWGFSPFEGPSFELYNSHSARWDIEPVDGDSIVVGRDSSMHLESDCVACVEKIALVNAKGKDLKATWKALDSEKLEVQLPLKDERSGQLQLKVAQYGLKNPDVVTVRTYAEAVHLELFKTYAGDNQGELTGSHLDQVSCVELDGICFTPSPDARPSRDGLLELTAENPDALSALQQNPDASANVTLNDGRVVKVPAKVGKARPKVTLVSKNLQFSRRRAVGREGSRSGIGSAGASLREPRAASFR